MRPPRLTDRTVLAAVQTRPMTGDTFAAARDYLAFSAPGLARHLDIPEDLITRLEAAGQDIDVPDTLADIITDEVTHALDIMTPAELRSARIALGMTLENLADATGIYYRRFQNSETGRTMINEQMRDQVHALLKRADADTSALTEHLRALAQGGRDCTVLTYQSPADLTDAQAELPPAPTSDTESPDEDAATALLRSAPNYAYHVNVAGRAARAVGARLRYR